VAKAGTVDDNDPVVLGSKIDQSAGFEVLDHAAVAMQKHQRLAGASFHVVQPDTVHIKELAGWRIVVLCFFRKMTIQKRGRRQRSCCNNCGDRKGWSRCNVPVSANGCRKPA
jgi:hypothetical protein